MALQLQKTPPEKKSKNALDLTNADRDFSQTEVEVEESAKVFSIKRYKRIHPYFGTLGHLIRNMNGGNIAVMEIIKEKVEHSGTQVSKKVRDLVTLWNSADDFSKLRVDILDHLCQIVKLERAKLWGLYQECIYEYQNLLVEQALNDKKLGLIENVDKFSKDAIRYKDRELMSKMTGLDKSGPLVQINDNSTIVNNNLSIKDSSVGFSFADMIKTGDKVVRGENVRELKEAEENVRLLEEGNSEDFIEGDIIKNEKELIER